MSNDYFEYSDSLTPGAVAKAEEVAAEFEGLQAAFDLLPQPRPDGLGFLTAMLIPEATGDGEAATWGQLKALEESAQTASANAISANNNVQDVLLPDINTKYTSFTATYSDVEDWRDETSAFRNEAKQWAASAEDVEVEQGEYSAKHWAIKAAQITSGARTYIGGWSASAGSLPISTPQSTDAGKFWRITASGTLPQVGAVSVEDELSIKSDLNYEVLPTNSSVQSVNGQTGSVTVTKTDVGLSNVPNYPATDSTTDGSSSKLATAAATGALKALVDGAQSTANSATTTASNAQSSANAAQTSASNAQAAAGTAQNAADAAQSTANAVTAANDSLTSTVNGISSTVSSNASAISSAQSDATQALSNASDAQDTADSAATIGNNALSAASSAAASAGNAQGTANTAITNAAAAQSTADTAVTNAATAQAKADAAQTVANATSQHAAIEALNTQLRNEFEALLSAYNARWAESGAFPFNTDINLNGNDIDAVKRIDMPGTSGNGSVSRTGTDLDINNTVGDLNLSIAGVPALTVNNDRTIDLAGGISRPAAPANHTRVGNKYLVDFDFSNGDITLTELQSTWQAIDAGTDWGVPDNAVEILLDFHVRLEETAGVNGFSLLFAKGQRSGTDIDPHHVSYVNSSLDGVERQVWGSVAVPLELVANSAYFSYIVTGFGLQFIGGATPMTPQFTSSNLYYRGYTLDF